MPLAGLNQLRVAAPADEVKGLGDQALIATFAMTTGARLEVAVSSDKRLVGLKPWQAQAEQLIANTLTPQLSSASVSDTTGAGQVELDDNHR